MKEVSVGDSVLYQGQEWRVSEVTLMASLKAGATTVWAKVQDLRPLNEQENS
jgi:hypothetical protein